MGMINKTNEYIFNRFKELDYDGKSRLHLAAYYNRREVFKDFDLVI